MGSGLLLLKNNTPILQTLEVINRAGVAGAVLQTASSLIDWVTQPFPPDLQIAFTSKA